MVANLSSSALFQPAQVGNMLLKNRVVMAPLTRFRADAAHVPHPIVGEYYAQRASIPGTLLITEATLIKHQAGGFAHVPGIWSDEQIARWKEVIHLVLVTFEWPDLFCSDHTWCSCKRFYDLPPAVGSWTYRRPGTSCDS